LSGVQEVKANGPAI